MGKIAKTDQTPKNLPSYFDSKGLSKFFEGVDATKYLESKEREFWITYGTDENRVRALMDMLNHNVEKARTRWACIRSKSQRTKKTGDRSGIFYSVKSYSNLTQVKPVFENISGTEPPDRSGEQINEFTERSRQRLLQKAKKLNKSGLSLPYFVTLTYHSNFQDCRASKKHLNAFFQRWRRRGKDFAYIWKMEPQKRGAIHYHLAIFLPQKIQSMVENRDREKAGAGLQWLRETIQSDWAEVTKHVDGVDVPFTKFSYIRTSGSGVKKEKLNDRGRSRNVKTRCGKPRTQFMRVPGIDHELYGTNVREVDNWEQFIGYIGSYMDKKVKANPWGADMETGRFWGFSNNLDFSSITESIVDDSERENIQHFLLALNTLDFKNTIERLIKSAKRARNLYTGKELRGKLRKYRNTFESQKRRYYINRERAINGCMMQFQVKEKDTRRMKKYLRDQKVNDYFALNGTNNNK